MGLDADLEEPSVTDGGTMDAGAAESSTTDSGTDSTQMVCPVGMVYVNVPGLRFCIDAYEASRAEYDRFVAAVGLPDGSLPQGNTNCTWNTSLTPLLSLGDDTQKPVVGIDHCDALAYCASRGKRLCKSIVKDSIVGADTEWYQACSRGGINAYPYGSTLDASACALRPSIDASTDPSTTVPSGVPSACEGGYPGLYNTIGNVWEWIDQTSTLSDAGRNKDIVHFMGGAYGQTAEGTRCNFYNGLTREYRAIDVGVRCCADPNF